MTVRSQAGRLEHSNESTFTARNDSIQTALRFERGNGPPDGDPLLNTIRLGVWMPDATRMVRIEASESGAQNGEDADQRHEDRRPRTPPLVNQNELGQHGAGLLIWRTDR